jgi:hypothetical protein
MPGVRGYTRRAGHGPWTQLANQAVRLRILRRQGQHRQVLQQVLALRKQLVAWESHVVSRAARSALGGGCRLGCLA